MSSAPVPGPRLELPLIEGEDPTCGPPLGVDPMPRDEAEQMARALKAIADPTRLQMLSMLLAAPDGEACVCDLTAPLAQRQPTISYHLKVLTDAGIVTRSKRGAWVWYSVRSDRAELLTSLLHARVQAAA
ncbi:metalloregulator ArsR/SmtB family transcription factor [Streptomyces sp. TRM76323]|uniref:Metalloregulator ArsR/SmtB family transcription factor n=1 Tax=Streptomyces tamarix TaxID=3078565 RepID=A0ABU3QMP4_9ACTN|nr:metalloregulator ArsR/SmtB family transcription factor [Streptomyces tamarix]MDT9683719.1 metalloregulator ArsR/SmtB family transcription factor [Streptomyces tamarix]